MVMRCFKKKAHVFALRCRSIEVRYTDGSLMTSVTTAGTPTQVWVSPDVQQLVTWKEHLEKLEKTRTLCCCWPPLLAHRPQGRTTTQENHRLVFLITNSSPSTTISAACAHPVPPQSAYHQHEVAEVTFPHPPTDSESNI